MAPRRRERRPGVSSRQPQSLVGRATASSSTNLQAIPTLAELGRRGHGALEHADVDLELRLLGRVEGVAWPCAERTHSRMGWWC